MEDVSPNIGKCRRMLELRLSVALCVQTFPIARSNSCVKSELHWRRTVLNPWERARARFRNRGWSRQRGGFTSVIACCLQAPFKWVVFAESRTDDRKDVWTEKVALGGVRCPQGDPKRRAGCLCFALWVGLGRKILPIKRRV